MNKIFLFTLLFFSLFNFSCNDNYDFNNPVDAQANLTLQAPTNLQVVSIVETTVVLSYKDANNFPPYPNAKLDYEIEQSTDASYYSKVNNVSLSGTQATVTGTFSSTLTYSFRMRAKAANSLSGYSNVTTANLSFPAPSNLTISTMTETNVRLTWTNTNTLATIVVIEKSKDGTNYKPVDSVSATAINKDVAGVYSSDTTYYFRIKNKSIINQSAYTSTVSQKLGFSAPSNFTFAFTSDIIAKLTWTNTNTMATTVIIEKSANGTNYVVVDSTVATATTKDVVGVYSSDTTYYFRIKYKSTVNKSAYTTPVSQKLGFSAPSNFTFAFTSDIIAKLTWTNTNTIATTVIIEKSANGTNYVVVDSAIATATTKDVVGIYSSDTTYYFRIKYRSNANQSVYTTPVSQKLGFLAPSNLAVNILIETKATVSWTNTNSLATTIIIEKSNNGTNYNVVDSTVATATTKDVAGIYSSDTTYYFRIKYKSSANQSAYTAPVSQKLGFLAPSNLAVNILIETKATVSWTNTNSLATTIIIEKSNNGTNYNVVDSTVATATTKDVAGIYSSDTTYYFRIKYKSTVNQSTYTMPVSQKLGFPAPTSLAISVIEETNAQLRWTNTNSLATMVIIEKSNNGINYFVVDSVVATATTKNVAGIYSSDTIYYFRIKYKSNVNNSAYTSPLSKKFLFPAPSNLQIISMTNTQVDFSWTDNSSFETSFEVEQSSNGTTFAVVKTVESNITSTSITGTFDITTIYYFRVQAKTTINKSGYSNIAHMQINSGMVLVQGGTFQMGSTSGYSDEVPVHSVTLGSFNIDKYEVTYEKWTDVYNWGLTHGYTDLPAGQNGYSPNGANNPVTSVNWYDIIKWCNARSEMEGLTPVYYTSNTSVTVYRTGQVDLAADAVKWTTNGYRLPTEAEWEFAARGGNNSQGYTYSGSNTIDYVAWYYNNSGYTTHTIGTKSANEVGIYDMSGNVWEWCWDWYGTYSGTAQTDPKGATSGAYRVLRGGSFNGDVVGYCRVAVRYDVNPYGRGINVGFRCTRD